MICNKFSRRGKVYFKLLLICSFIFQSACSIQNSHNPEISNNNKNSTKCSGISKETAIQIAKGYLALDYDLSGYKIKIETEKDRWKDRPEMWKITFEKVITKENENSFGGSPIVWIFKESGERFTVKHAK